MSDYTLNFFDRHVLRLITMAPRSSGYQLHEAMMADYVGDSKIRKALGWLIGPSVGQLYVSLAKLERFDLVASEWGIATKERGGHRPRLYTSRTLSAADGAKP